MARSATVLLAAMSRIAYARLILPAPSVSTAAVHYREVTNTCSAAESALKKALLREWFRPYEGTGSRLIGVPKQRWTHSDSTKILSLKCFFEFLSRSLPSLLQEKLEVHSWIFSWRSILSPNPAPSSLARDSPLHMWITRLAKIPRNDRVPFVVDQRNARKSRVRVFNPMNTLDEQSENWLRNELRWEGFGSVAAVLGGLLTSIDLLYVMAYALSFSRFGNFAKPIFDSFSSNGVHFTQFLLGGVILGVLSIMGPRILQRRITRSNRSNNDTPAGVMLRIRNTFVIYISGASALCLLILLILGSLGIKAPL
jgi:hypothetical protein